MKNPPIHEEIDRIAYSIRDLDETIPAMAERLVLFTENLQRRFTSLEVLLGKLNAQGSRVGHGFNFDKARRLW